ncbi:MAG: hypothetical protein AB1644_08685 [Candidatus Zixiibacteriota bacterium]
MRRLTLLGLLAVVATLFALGCQRTQETIQGSNYQAAPIEAVEESEPQNLDVDAIAAGLTAKTAVCPTPTPPPGPLTTVAFGDNALTFWPFTGNDFSSQGQDPINLIFVGHADPRDIRAALLSLDGDRTAIGFPDASPFNSRWLDDVTGDMQTAYGETEGWTGSAIQLACGSYGPARFHLRLFRQGDWTLANVHFEIQVPGTTNHQVISWEVAEQFVIVDLMRSGLLDPDIPMMPTGQINPAPFREIPDIIYNGLPVELRALIGGPLGNVSAPVPIGTDGVAMILNLGGSVTWTPGIWVQDFVINFDQVIPKPFCSSGPLDYLYANGPVHMRQVVRLTSDGKYVAGFIAQGSLNLTPVNPLTDPPTPVGETYPARVYERHESLFMTNYVAVSSYRLQKMLPVDAPNHGVLRSTLRVSTSAHNVFTLDIHCTPGAI